MKTLLGLLSGLLLATHGHAQDMTRVSLEWGSPLGGAVLNWQPTLVVGAAPDTTHALSGWPSTSLQRQPLRLPLNRGAFKLNADDDGSRLNWFYVIGAGAALATAVIIAVGNAEDHDKQDNVPDDQPGGCNGVGGSYNLSDPMSSEPVILGPDCF